MIAEELALYLQTMGHGTKSDFHAFIQTEFGAWIEGKDLFLGFQPDSPDDCITVYDESASVLEESHALSTDACGVQVLVRNQSYTSARDALIAIHQDLAGFGGEPFVSGGKMVHAVFIVTSPTSIGRDDKGRSEWTAHYWMRVESQGDLFRS